LPSELLQITMELIRVVTSSEKTAFPLPRSRSLLALLPLALLLPTIIIGVSPVHASSNNAVASGCDSVVGKESQAAAAPISQSQAIAAAASTLAAYDSGYSPSFNSIFYRLSFDSTCAVTLENVNVVYDLRNNAKTVETLEISLNPSLTTVLNVTEYAAITSFGTVLSNNWDGYEYYNSNGISESGASWSEPSATRPSGSCQWDHCDFAFWVGETAVSGGTSTALAQTGTDSGIYCAISCTYYYYDWYEFLPASPTQCNNISVGDSITSDVWNAYNSGAGGYQYSVSTTDNTTSQTCYTYTTTAYMGVAYYTQFMGETPSDSNGRGYAILPQFSTLSESGGWYEDNSYNSYTIGSGYANEWDLDLSSVSNSCNGSPVYLNICNSSVSSGDFTETYLSSSGT